MQSNTPVYDPPAAAGAVPVKARSTMRVIVAGAGEIGWYIAGEVSRAGHDVTLIDNDSERIRRVRDELDVQTVSGLAGSVGVLMKAGAAESDLLVAVTASDDTNLVCGSLARKLGCKRVMCRVDEAIYRKSPDVSYRNHFRVDELVSPEMLTALELASVVRNPGSMAVEHFARGQLEMQQLYAETGTKLVGKTLKDLQLPAGVRICSIERGGAFRIPHRDDVIEPKDRITILGKTEQVVEARRGFEAQPNIRKVVIMGGGHTALSLARRLRTQFFRLTIVERNGERCRELADTLPAATILNGDGTSLTFLKEERIENAEVFISTTASDEANIMSAIQAKNLGVKQVLVVIHRPDYANLMEKMGIDRAVSPRVVMAKETLALLRKSGAWKVTELGNGAAEILEIIVKGEDFVGKKLMELPLPPQSLVLSVQRNLEVFVPDAQTVFHLDDVVLIASTPEHHKKIVQLVTGE